MQDRTEVQATNFNAIRISVASPEQILNWSHGEVTKPETINYRTLRPEKDGLFCERLFGPTKDWECFCGKYKRIRYRGVVCDRCGVEVTRSKVRRERMGHIRLAAPVAHIWFSKTTPSRLGLLLDLSPRNLERVLYFAQHIVISVDDEKRAEIIEEERLRVELEKERIRGSYEEKLTELQEKLDALEASGDPESLPESVAVQTEKDALEDQVAKEEGDLEIKLQEVISELEDLRPLKILAESKYRELKERYDDLFNAGMGAESILDILRNHDLEAIREGLVREMRSTSGQRRKKAIKRLQVVEAFRNSGNRVEDIILTVLPVLPPELRPMVQLDGGRFATSDLNDLYRRVINRNNRLKRLMDLGAPEIIIRNEKRMLQESVDALIDNGRRGRPIQGSHNHKLKSLSDLLRGKQGRFRQNLLGKRVDYSGRSVIVVGPELKMNQCGLPKRMALELFKPFVMHRLVMLGVSPNIKSAKRMVERARPEVWDILEEVIKDRPVMLNRAPTLHRLGIQAFMPVLIEGNAIQIHPLVCSAFNADFDGDQMAVHVPLSRMAVHESQVAMLSTHNMLSPASGEPLVAPTLDMVLGCYYLTEIQPGDRGEGSRFYDYDEANIAFADGHIGLRAKIYVKNIPGYETEESWVETTLGRLIFKENLPQEIGFKNYVFNSRAIKELTTELYQKLSNDDTAEALDKIKQLGFKYATTSGITIAINDIQISGKKSEILQEADGLVESYEDQYLSGLMSEDERYNSAVEAWTWASDQTEHLVKDEIEIGNYGGIGVMALSGAKGNIMQIKQMAGMRGLMSNPGGRIIDLPVKSSFREGLSALEYFISTHGARKGLADTALRTADS
ncbi:MAG: DNA-directed RNA polymerase subunit beta', partial [Chloroflexota bacterium]|nr:DNA-directed RNA polymerase subunit beta' [Chloroflexota bacterium]